MSTARRELTPVQQVCEAIKSPALQEQIKQALPEGVSLDRFTRVTLTAIQQNPGIVEKDRTSLYMACVRCAADGLMPDGREAALVAFGDRVQYMPMVWGITKKLAEGNIAISAQCVYSGDTFERELGDEERIIHKAPPLGTVRGDLVGVYAIARDRNTGRVLDREVMDKAQVETVRSVSRAKNGDLWTKWIDEAYRKTAIRRLSKRLHGIADNVRSLIEADDELVDLDQAPAQQPETGGRPRALAAVVAQGKQADPAPVDANGATVIDPIDDAASSGDVTLP